MFKLESYITPIILSYVDKYIKNFRPEDSQFSLWGGDVSFNNLDLRLEVLEQELQLPFSFVSGHIHELLIHVPWTKIASEPITITINTIECILKLRSDDGENQDATSQVKERQRKPNKEKKELETPPGYIHTLVNKIVSNIRIYCNNLILKYVEEDIVLSMNVKLLTFESANAKWEAAYTDVSPIEVILRKLIAVNDLTICLDKRNASGKIEVYQEPMLYRCSLIIHFLIHYHSATAKKSSNTRVDIYCNNMEFSMTEQQVPMLMRLVMLLQALQQKELKQSSTAIQETVPAMSENSEAAETSESWAGWAWSFVPSILPTQQYDEWSKEQQMALIGHALQIGFYVDNLSLTFKVSESKTERGYYQQKKLKYWPLITIQLQGLFSETITLGKKWTHVAFGISEIVLKPLGYCSCSFVDITDDQIGEEYLRAGEETNNHKTDSLFDAEAVENKGQRRIYNISWDYHVETTSEATLLERTPALAMDLIYQLEIPDDMSSDRLSEIGSDLEYSNLAEKSLIRFVVGPFRMKLCSGFLHRMSSLQAAASLYEYTPYSATEIIQPLQELQPPSEDDFDALNEMIPMKTMQITVLAPVIEFQLMDHPFFQASKGHFFKKRKKSNIQTGQPSTVTITDTVPNLPRFTIECQCIDVRITNPMYTKRLVQTTCQLPNPPQKMFEACHFNLSVKVISLCSRLILDNNRQTTIIIPSSASFELKKIITPEYWINPDVPHLQMMFDSESIAITGSNPKMMLVAQILYKLIQKDCGENDIMNSSLISEASKDYGMAYLEFCIEAIRFKKVVTKSTNTINMSLGSIKSFIFNPIMIYNTNDTGSNFYSTREIQQVLFISGPEEKQGKHKKEGKEEPPLFSALIQFPLEPDNDDHAPILIFTLQEIRICVDPLLCKWLLYKPTYYSKAESSSSDTFQKKPRMSDTSIADTPRRSGTPHESVHSSTDIDQLFLPQRNQRLSKEDVDIQEQIYEFLKRWFKVWKGMLICGDISQCTIYFPVQSLSAIGSQGIQEAVDEAMRKEYPPEILVVTLPFSTVRSAAQKYNLYKYINTLPVKLPDNIWNKDKSSFPWTISISDLSCYTLQFGKKLDFLKPVSLNATVGLSTKSVKPDIPDLKKDSNLQEKLAHTKQSVVKTSENLLSSPGSAKPDIGSLGVCIHIDMTPIDVTMSEVQICLIASIMYGLTEVAFNLMPDTSKDIQQPVESLPPITGQSSTMSPTVIKESTLDSVSEDTPHMSVNTENMATDNVKLTAWIQWTITRFSMSILSHDAKDLSSTALGYTHRPKLKLMFEAEDIVSSVDFQSVYLKIKSKIGSASIQHFKRESNTGRWKTGPFLGFVLRSVEEARSSEKQDDSSFANVTITRASCKHTHNLWGAVRKNKFREKVEQHAPPSRYITEIVVVLQPIDIVVSLTTLRNYYMVLEPLLRIPDSVPKKPVIVERANRIPVSNRNLPLAYVECRGFRIIIPSEELGDINFLHNVIMFQIESIHLSPNPENPICRTPSRPDIYQQAAQSRILNVPGSEVEDRQYQLDISGISLTTGKWEEFVPMLKHQRISHSHLKTMSENPALEWNSLGKGKLGNSPEPILWPVISKFDIYFIAAPAMIYKNDVICGHSIEINFISDIQVNIALCQMKLVSSLANEFSYIFHTPISQDVNRPQVVFPYSGFTSKSRKSSENAGVDLSVEIVRDSGFETSDLKSFMSYKTKESLPSGYMHKIPESEASMSTQPKTTNVSLQAGTIPLEALVTSGKISFVLYDTGAEVDKKIVPYKHKKNKITLKDPKNEKGYEASEEGSIDERVNDTQNKIQPLLYLSLSQPNTFFSHTQMGTKLQLSCYDIGIKISGRDYNSIKTIPTGSDFPVNLLETKSGEPHPDTGVLPAFLTLKWIQEIGSETTLDIEIAKPTKILVSLTRYAYLMEVHQRIMQQFAIDKEKVIKEVAKLPLNSKLGAEVSQKPRQNETYVQFRKIKDTIGGVSVVKIRFSQVVVSVKTDNGPEVDLSIGKLNNVFTLSNRPERLCNMITLDCLTLGVIGEDYTRLLLNPWSFSIEVCLFWESWQSIESNPQIQISMESESIRVDVSPEQINCVEMVMKEMTEFASNLTSDTSLPVDSPHLDDEDIKIPNDIEQHYKDDLRAGAFQFVDSSTNNIDELPLPYQVMFWHKKFSAMAWRYPQPRALTKVRVFPVPFKITNTSEKNDQQVLCHLEYWSDCHGSYQPFTQFHLSESEMCHLELPRNEAQPAVACIWRVVLTVSDIGEKGSSKIIISPRALAGCIRVDSYFNQSLIPDLTLSLMINRIDASLYNYFNKKLDYTMPEDLKHYTCDLAVPESQCFLTLTLSNTKAHLSTWKFKMFSFDSNTGIKCSVLDYAYLTNLELIELFKAKVNVNISKNINISFVSNPIHFKLGASAVHTLLVSTQLWGQTMIKDCPDELIIVTHYVVCNDTNVNIRFGQSGNEEILLQSRQCHLYSWRSQKYKQVLRVALEDHTWIWSEPFSIDHEYTRALVLSEKDNMSLIVTVKSLSATQKKIIFSGQLVLCNMLMEHFELKVVEESQKDKDFKNLSSYIINGRSTPPSLLLNTKKKHFLRIRFFGLESAWSGDIPLMENTKCAQPWLVKVPLQERGQFLSIWCRIVLQSFRSGKKILAILWPLFMVRSNLPVSSKVQIETPTLNVHLENSVRGRGEFQQLYCPGTIDHSHQLSFQLDGGTPTSNPYVPLNYSLVDQKEFFKKPDQQDINEILDVLSNYDKIDWPYFGEDIDDSEYVIDDQPLTHVQVKYQNACEHSSALLVELLPWCLMLNTLGCPIGIFMNEKELCHISHHGIVTPPKLEETFHIGVGVGKTWNMSAPLQLAKPDWSQTFYMPKITGTIPFDGNIKTAVQCGAYVCMVSINSSVHNEIRLLKVGSTHILSNHMSVQLHVVCFAVPDTENVYDLPKNIDKHSFIIAPHLHQSNAGVPIIQWYCLGNSAESLEQFSGFALYVSFSVNPKFGWSCPVRVDNNLIRRSIALQTEEESIPIALICEEHKGQTYLFLHHDVQPQTLLINRSGAKLFCAQYSNDENVIVPENKHFRWICSIENGSSSFYTMPVLCEKFPELPQIYTELCMVIASDPEGDPQGFQWSTPICLENYNDQFIRIPFYGDVKVAVVNSTHTIYVTIESVSEVEISARDIRVRLTMHENELLETDKSITDEDKISLSSGTYDGTTYYSAEGTNDQENKSLISYKRSKIKKKTHFSVEKRTKISDTDISLKSEMVPALIEEIERSAKKKCDMRILVFLQSIIFTFTNDSENSGERVEVACITCENIAVTICQSELMYVSVSATDLQIDNQMYNSGSYDFPVVFIGQNEWKNSVGNIFNAPLMQLINNSQIHSLISLELTLDSWMDRILHRNVNGVRNIRIQVKPLSAYVEDVFVTKLVDMLKVLVPTSVVIWPKPKRKVNYLSSGMVHVPLSVIWASGVLAKPIIVQTFMIEPLSISLSVHYSIKVYIALDQSPLQFGKFERKNLLTTPYRLGHALTMHYLSGAIFGAGWVVGSLELLGSPGGLARAMGTGLRDFVSLPYSGLWQGPWAFLTGITHGTTSLMKHITAGTVHSITKLASSVARNLDRLTLDEEHLKRTEEARRQKPQGFREGFLQGLTGLGISLLGAVGGIAHHPLQSVISDGSPRSLVTGVGLGIVGIFTKPFSAAAELVALSGQGFLQGAGWNTLPEAKMSPIRYHIFSGENSLLKYYWKYTQMVTKSNILFVTDATEITSFNQYEAVSLILTLDALVIINTDEDATQRILCLNELRGCESSTDPTLLSLKLILPKPEPKIQDDLVIEMDPVSRARVADYVRNTTGFVHLPEDLIESDRSMSISPDLTEENQQEASASEPTTLTFYMSAQNRNYFLCLMSLARKQSQNYNFPVF